MITCTGVCRCSVIGCMKWTSAVKLPSCDLRCSPLSLGATLLLTPPQRTHGNPHSHAPARLREPATRTAGSISTLLLACNSSHEVEDRQAGPQLELLCCVSGRCSAWQAVPSRCRTSSVGCVLAGMCSRFTRFGVRVYGDDVRHYDEMPLLLP